MKLIDKKKLRTFYLKLIKDEISPEITAKSAAIGLFCGFFIPIGLQIPFTLLLAFAFRARKIISLIFTLPTNIYTVWLIYPVQCWVGGKLLRLKLSFPFLLKTFREILKNFSISDFLELSSEIIIAFFAGGLLFGVISAVIGYFTVYGMVVSYRQRRKKKLADKIFNKHS
ncbi:MAG TPA: DUF2062 domain-containing protein [Victivallales bacterium]|nr:DUF2062 domain-containing protein [Victivallales bacterium]HPO90988.1 DUF2062 domain-containing protein [Victivallales bacterium]HRR06093.1 DUF2062 domain-containing protein [Victivallales bacterium]HRR28244.1 DUF2062 domain-containing protein [Victivallales bacterium]HRU01624.1 DUF2062 domain-containing protein [Victivallales bacterium]